MSQCVWKENLTDVSVACVYKSVDGRLCYIQHKKFMSRWMACTGCRNWMTRCNNVDTRRRVSVENDVSHSYCGFAPAATRKLIPQIKSNSGTQRTDAAKHSHLCSTPVWHIFKVDKNSCHLSVVLVMFYSVSARVLLRFISWHYELWFLAFVFFCCFLFFPTLIYANTTKHLQLLFRTLICY